LKFGVDESAAETSIAASAESIWGSNDANTEVLIMEDGVLVNDFVLCWDSECLLLDVDVDGWVLNNEWYFLCDGVLFDFPDGEVSDVGHFIWYLDLCGVVLPDFGDIWLVNGDSVEGLVPLGLLEFPLNVVWLLLVLSDGNLLRDDVWHLLDDGVVNSLCNFIGDLEFFLIRDLVVDGVWNLLGDNIWDLVDDGVWNLSAGDIGDLNLNFVWNLS